MSSSRAASSILFGSSAASRAGATLLRGVGGASRRHASSKYANFKAYKNNWVEQNEILRENRFASWAINGKTALPTLFMAVVFPVFVYSMVKGEYAIKEQRAGVPVSPRF